MLSVKDLDKAYLNNNLIELLKLVSDEELNSLRARIECDDILGIRIYILNAIMNEMNFRKIDILGLKYK